MRMSVRGRVWELRCACSAANSSVSWKLTQPMREVSFSSLRPSLPCPAAAFQNAHALKVSVLELLSSKNKRAKIER